MIDDAWDVDAFLRSRECEVHDFAPGASIDLDGMPQKRIWMCKNCHVTRLLSIGEDPNESNEALK